MIGRLLFAILITLAFADIVTAETTITVAADGSGQYKSIQEAIMLVPAGSATNPVAIRVDGDRAVFRNCRFLGWQDTILIDRGRQYFENCYITGHVDFIFGGATAFFENCHIHCRGNGYITAASTPDNQPFGFVFSHCRITGDAPELKTNIGRPWRAYSAA